MKFNETRSQERLINLMLQAGVEWPSGATHAVQYKGKGVHFSLDKPFYRAKYQCWSGDWIGFSVAISVKNQNWHQTIITREQYEARDGWITWHGGDRPIDCRCDIKWRHGDIDTGVDPGNFLWRADRGIIAYRIHKPAAAEPCESVKACIPDQSTIEQLIAEWNRQKVLVSKAFAARAAAQELYEDERDKAKQAHKRVQDKLAELGWPAEQPEPEQPDITDWRDLRLGDVIWWSGDEDFDEGQYEVLSIERHGYEGVHPIEIEPCWVNTRSSEWKFIRRPQ